MFAGNFKEHPLYKLAQVVPDTGKLIGMLFYGISTAQAFINMHILPWVSKKQLPELPIMWLIKRLDPIIEQRQQTPTSRVDVLQLMLQVMTDKPIDVSQINYTRP